MNKIETLFLDTFHSLEESEKIDACFNLESQKVIGIYKVDFVYGTCVIEIDGHEFHKTKEQREHDYKRERYLLKKGYTVVLYMGTELFLEPEKCVIEVIGLGEEISIRDHTINRLCKRNDIESMWGKPLFPED